MARAFEDLFGVPDALDTVPVAGRTDAWIVAEVAARHGLSSDTLDYDLVRRAYLTHLEREILKPGPGKGVLPGIRPLLETLWARGLPMALLTGNAKEGARIKLEHFDLWRYFRWGAFGDELHDRNALLPEVLARVAASGGPVVAPSQTVVVGDTLFDIAVAVAAGARSVGVGTGSHDPRSLLEGGATVALTDLADLPVALAALGVDEPR
jgi:phosphoglycolate phosphatase-like HAD superfamily hydrolase